MAVHFLSFGNRAGYVVAFTGSKAGSRKVFDYRALAAGTPSLPSPGSLLQGGSDVAQVSLNTAISKGSFKYATLSRVQGLIRDCSGEKM